jgi:hypothetical protein
MSHQLQLQHAQHVSVCLSLAQSPHLLLYIGLLRCCCQAALLLLLAWCWQACAMLLLD